MTQIPDGQIQREIHRQQDQHEEVVPTDQTGHEGQRTPRVLQRQRRVFVAAGILPVAGGEAAVHRTEGQEDEEEEDVCAE